MAISQQTRGRISQGVLTLGVMVCPFLYLRLFRTRVYEPLALLASGGLMLACFLAAFAINPPTGQMRLMAWGIIALFAVGFMVAAAIMHWEASAA